MTHLYKLVRWDNKWHCEFRGDPLCSKQGNILSFSNKEIINKVLANESPHKSLSYNLCSDIIDENYLTFQEVWSDLTYKALAIKKESELNLNIPDYMDFLRQSNILLLNQSSVLNQFKLFFNKLYNQLSLQNKVLATHLIYLKLEPSCTILYLLNQLDLEGYIESLAYIQHIRLGHKVEKYKKNLSTNVRDLIKFKYYLS
ncbi:MAG: hypothetical protein COB02_07520 [Candidatus Cloacimonadota bacterium]|nr:MAG: hypothetical protein COB02_07520 [Candidatus Cloacimonadota bacterium]